MRITSLTLQDLRRYRDHQVELAPGLTVVRGPNEAGKSTLQRAIELALTRKVTSAASDLDNLVSWDGGPEARTAIDMAFTYEDEFGEPRRGRLEKSFRGAKGQVRLELDGEVITDPARADEELAKLSGVPTEAFFRSTASVRHHELAGLQRDEAALRDRLQASISGGDVGTSRAKRKLERALQNLQSKGAKNPGRLKSTADEATDVAARLRAGEEGLVRLERDRDVLVQAKERRSEAELTLAERRSMLEKARQAERLTAERETARERFERYRNALAEQQAIAELEQSHPSAHPPAVLRPALDRLRTLESTMAALRSMLEGEVEVRFELPPVVTWRPTSLRSVGLVLAGLVIAAGTYGLRVAGILDLGSIGLIGGGLLAAVGLALAFRGWWLRRSIRVENQLRDVEVARRLRGRSQFEIELKEAEAEHFGLLERFTIVTLAEGEERLALEEAHIAQIEQRRARLSGLIGDEPRDEIETRQNSAALEIEQKTAALEALGPIAKEPRARERLEVEVTDAEQALNRARDDEAQARARVEQNPADAEEVAVLAERHAVLTEQLESLRRRERVYAATLREIVAAEQATMKRATRYLERSMVGDIARVTDGRYRRVRIDDTNLGIEVFAPERDDWVPVTDLSQGTLDVVYLAARLGLVRLVTGESRPPLVFDDPFVTLDDVRAPRALHLLREIAADFQVIYLTASSRYDSLADLVVELPGPTAADTGVELGAVAPA